MRVKGEPQNVDQFVNLMKSVMPSIKPKWSELIANGKKTIEVRKTRPKLETPFKCYIYCTKSTGSDFLWVLNEIGRAKFAGKTSKIADVFGAKDVGGCYKCNGKVIGEFVCDYILEITPDTYGYHEYCISDDDLNASCLTVNDLWEYANGKTLYGWHISDLVIYDEPKELSEFGLPRPPQSWYYVSRGSWQ
jgi:predicted transcriptional regulator